MSATNIGEDIPSEDYYRAKALLNKLQLQEQLLYKTMDTNHSRYNTMFQESEQTIAEYEEKTIKIRSLLEVENAHYNSLKEEADCIKNDHNTKERRHILILNQLSAFQHQHQELAAQINTFIAHRSITSQCEKVIKQKINEQNKMKAYYNKKISYSHNLITHQSKIQEEKNTLSLAVQKKQELVDNLLREVLG